VTVAARAIETLHKRKPREGAGMARPYGPLPASGIDLFPMTPSSPSDGLAASEDKAGRIEALILPHLDAAYNLVRWLARNEQDAADIVHEAFLRAVRYADSFQGGNARAWWLAIVRSTYLTWVSKTAGGRSPLSLEEVTKAGDGDQPADQGRNPEELAHWSQCADMLTELVEALPPGFREIILLREMEELSYREIAELLQVPVGTVMSRLARAREMLKRAWAARQAG
jgi:RNA polymerase sigma-70 factor, ECF subfamily